MMNRSVVKRRIQHLNQSREAFGSQDDVTTTKAVTSGDSKFDDEFQENYRNMIEEVCIRKGYKSIRDMMEEVRKRRPDKIQKENDDLQKDTKENMGSSKPTTSTLSLTSSTAPSIQSASDPISKGISDNNSINPVTRTPVVNPYRNANVAPISNMNIRNVDGVTENNIITPAKSTHNVNPYRKTNMKAIPRINTPSPHTAASSGVINPYIKKNASANRSNMPLAANRINSHLNSSENYSNSSNVKSLGMSNPSHNPYSASVSSIPLSSIYNPSATVTTPPTANKLQSSSSRIVTANVSYNCNSHATNFDMKVNGNSKRRDRKSTRLNSSHP